MNRKLLLTTLLLCCMAVTKAQTNGNVFAKGDNQVALGVGFWNGNNEFDPQMPQISLNYQYCLFDFDQWGSVGVGLHGSYLESKYKRSTTQTFIRKEGVLGAKVTYHYTILPYVEAYGGLMLGYRNIDFKYPQGFDKSGVVFSPSVGVNCFVTNHLGIFVGMGDGVYLNTGIVCMF